MGTINKVLAAAILSLGSGGVLAGTIDSFNLSVDFSSQACANYGDFQSCSAQYLNLLNFGTPTPTGSNPTYVVDSSQGKLQNPLVIVTNGNAAVSNTDIGTNIDNAYNIFATPGQDTVYGTSILAGQKVQNTIIDPDTPVTGEVTGAISGVNGGGAAATAWDIGLQALIDGLTFDGTRHDLLIFFDNNQEGVTEAQDLLISGLVCVRDSTGALADKCFELVDENGTGSINLNDNIDPSLFNTTLHYGDPLPQTPGTPGPVLANGTLCVDNSSKQVVAFNVQSSNDCPANSTFINNNLGSNLTEFIVGIPELNANLETYLNQGYDLVSTQLLFANQTDGFEDVFMLAGAARPTIVPEPGTLLLLGLGILGLVVVHRRRQVH